MNHEQAPLILHTKLHRPAIGNDYVPRLRLLERLTRNPHRALTLVAAPAGFGKTTLITSWLEISALPSTWFSIDENDDSLPIFLSYLVAAVHAIFPDTFSETEVLLRSSHMAPTEVFTTTFINEVARLPRDFILVLDDYHFVRDEAIHQFIIRLIRQRPRQLHLVLITRITPPFPLAMLRAAPAALLEIRMRDLRFTTEETRAFVIQAVGDHLNDEALKGLEERTEGWAAGLRLAALYLQNHPDPQAFLQIFRGTSTYVMDYLIDQVLSQQPPNMVDMLLRTSILNRFCASLCDAISFGTTGIGSRAFLDWVEQTNLFVVPLDDDREWQRYDHLFRELLLSRLQSQYGPAEITALHLRASDWFAANGLVDEAVRHALAGRDGIRAARVVEQNIHLTLAREDSVTLDRWLRTLPEDLKQIRVALLVAQAWQAHFQGDTRIIGALLKQAEQSIAQGEPDLDAAALRWMRGSTAALWSEYWFAHNELQRAIEYSQRALDILPLTAVFERRTAVAYLCYAKQAVGRIEDAERLVTEELERASAATDSDTAQIYRTLCWIRLVSGDLQQVDKLAQHLLKQTQRGQLMLSLSWAHYFLGLLHYEWNDLDRADQHFKAIAEHRYSAHFTAAQESLLGLALIRQAQGSAQEARETTEALAAFNLERAGSITVKTRSAQARLAVLQGNLEAAAPWVNELTLAVPDRPIPLFDEPCLTRARVLIAEKTADSLRRAAQLLDGVQQLATATHNARRLIEIFALQALALHAQGQNDGALDLLQQAVVMAQPGGFIRMFVDMGQPMAALLISLAKRGVAPNYLNRLIAAFTLAHAESTVEHAPHSPVIPSESTRLLLTTRELEVLNLLNSPLSDKEIAQRLFITLNTIKRHTGSIYHKLGVHSRRRAVAKAKDLHILHASASI